MTKYPTEDWFLIAYRRKKITLSPSTKTASNTITRRITVLHGALVRIGAALHNLNEPFRRRPPRLYTKNKSRLSADVTVVFAKNNPTRGFARKSHLYQLGEDRRAGPTASPPSTDRPSVSTTFLFDAPRERKKQKTKRVGCWRGRGSARAPMPFTAAAHRRTRGQTHGCPPPLPPPPSSSSSRATSSPCVTNGRRQPDGSPVLSGATAINDASSARAFFLEGGWYFDRP